MKNNDFIRRFKEEVAPFLRINETSKSSETASQSAKTMSPKSPFDLNEKKPVDELRSTILMLALGVGAAVILVSLFGQKWLSDILNQANGSYIGIAIAAGISLIGVSIVSGILKLIFGFIKLTPAFKDIATQKTFKPVFRAAYTFLMIYLTIFSFLKLMTFMAEQDIFGQIDHYAEQGFEFNIETDEGPKTIEVKEGKLNILTR